MVSGFSMVPAFRVMSCAQYGGFVEERIKMSSAHGSVHAAPVFRRIAEAVLQELKVAPDKMQ